MSKSFSLNQLTEGIRERHLGADTSRLVSKWTRTGLLRGLKESKRENMARMLENQAAQLLREANTLGAGGGSLGASSPGNLNGFTNIAFPIVRRVFGGLVANELVSIQPMSLPSGLLFYLDYTYGQDVGGDDAPGATVTGAGVANTPTGAGTNSVYDKGQSLYGNPAGNSIQQGANAAGGQYDLVGSSYSKVHSGAVGFAVSDAGSVSGAGSYAGTSAWVVGGKLHATGSDGKLIHFDPQLTKDIEEGTANYAALFFELNKGTLVNADLQNIKSLAIFSGSTAAAVGNLLIEAVPATHQAGSGIFNVRRLNELGTWNGVTFTADPFVTKSTSNAVVKVICRVNASFSATQANHLDDPAIAEGSDSGLSGSYAIADTLSTGPDSTTGTVLTIPSFESDFGATPQPIIPEIDIKIESIAVTATTRKLRARWSPELAQDLNAYHSMDAEVELTQILSEQIALEIDREILNDLLVEAKGANYYWSRAPGKFVKKDTGAVVTLASTLQPGPAFTGTVREWYETLVETIIDVGNQIHRKTLRGAANFLVVSPEVATIFEASVLYKPLIKLDGQGQVGVPFSIGAEAIGSLSNRFTVYKDPYFPRNKILVGYKGGSYLESGYVYAPYVPLIVTPTIFAPEDFTPRKGVMTRYGKKMVRADFYGTVTVLDMNII
jgi:hypothetical protein